MTHWQGRGQQVSDRGRGPGNRMRRWIAVALACTVFLLLVDNAFAQAPRRRFESLDTGRIGGVHALVEDADGFIWVGGDGGLARFDGRQLLPIAPDRIGGAVNALALQGDARVWVASDRGVLRWDLAGQRLDEVPCDGLVDGVGQLQVTGEAVLALSRSGLYRVDANTLACAPVHIAGLPEGQPVERFWQDGQQLWLAVRDRGLWLCPHACTRARPWAPALAALRVRWISAAADHGLYVGTHRRGLFRLDKAGAVVDHWWRGDDAPPDRAFTTNGVMSVQPTADGRLYAGLWAGGLMEVAADGDVSVRSKPLLHESTSLGGLNLRALMLARNGTLWIGHEDGLSILDPARNQVSWIGLAAEGQPGLDDSVVRALWKHEGKLYVGTAHGGINRVDLSSGSVELVKHDPKRGTSLPDNAIWDMLGTDDGGLMLATSGGLARLSTSTLEVESLASSPELPSDDVVSIAKASGGGYWLAAWAGGVIRVDKDGRVLKVWGADDGLGTETMVGVFEDAHGRVLASNSDGLFVLGGDGRFSAVVMTGTHRPGSPADMLAFQQTADGTLWMGADSGGLARWAPGAPQPAWVDDPTFGDVGVHAIKLRDQAGLWLATSAGLYAVDSQGHVLRRLGQGVGLEFDYVMTLLPGDGGHLWVGGRQGVNRIASTAGTTPGARRAPVISGVRLFNRPLHPDPDGALTAAPTHGGKLDLRYDQEMLTLDFALPGKPTPPGLRFRYRLQGFDHDWVEVAPDETRAVYTRLPPGKYRFQVQAGDGHGWGGPVADLPVTVSPPWWMTWWARTGFGLAVLAVLALGHWLRTWRLRRRAHHLEHVVLDRTKELREANVALQLAARTDALTHLVNRRGFLDAIGPRWTGLGSDAALFLADIDHFKKINDNFGHDVGDAVLVEVGKRLCAMTRAGDVVARWGGEEFLCLLVGDGARARAGAMLLAVADVGRQVPIGSIQVGITGGYATIRSGEFFRETVRRADALLYEGKRGGRNRVVYDDGCDENPTR